MGRSRPRTGQPYGQAYSVFEGPRRSSFTPKPRPLTMASSPNLSRTASGALSTAPSNADHHEAAMAGMSGTISTSSGESRANARQAATSAWLSNVPWSAPVAISMTR